MNETRSISIAALLLRLTLGVMFLMHSVYLKGVVFTLAGTAQFFVSIGLPAVVAYVVFALETIGGVLLVLGIRTRLVSTLLVPVLIGATWAHWGNGWLFQNTGGGWEYPLFLACATAVQALLGGGRFSFDRERHTPRDAMTERQAV